MDNDIKEDLREIKKSQARIELDIAMIKVDVSHHIKRSDSSERRLEKLEYVFIGLAVVGVLGGVVKLLIS